MTRPAHFKRLLRFLRRKGRSHEDAEDLIQEAMLRLHVYNQSEPVTNEAAFLTQVVHNLAIDQHRRERPDLRRPLSLEDVDALTPLIAPQPTPENTIACQQRLAHVEALLDAASPRTRKIYFAHRIGYSYNEIADDLKVSHITIKRHIARALLLIVEEGPLD